MNGYSNNKTFSINLSVDSLSLNVERVVEADEFMLRGIFSRGLFRETLSGEIVPDIADRFKFNKKNDEFEIFVKKEAFWSNGKRITSSDVLNFLSNVKRNKFKVKFLSCIVDKFIRSSSNSIRFRWRSNKSECSNPIEMLSHQSFYILDYRHIHKSLDEYLKSAPLSSTYSFLRKEKNSLVFKSLKYSYILMIHFSKRISSTTIYSRREGVKRGSHSLNAGYFQTLAFESTLSNKPDKDVLLCLRNKLLMGMNRELIEAHSFSLAVSRFLKIKSIDNQEKGMEVCKKIKIKVSESTYRALLTMFKRKELFFLSRVRDEVFKRLWLKEKIDHLIRIQKVRTSNVHSLFSSYFESGISPYKRISRMAKGFTRTNKFSYMKDFLNKIHEKGFIIPIAHMPTYIDTSVKCFQSSKIDIFFNIDEFLKNCNEI